MTMAVEIKELIIRAIAVEDSKTKSQDTEPNSLLVDDKNLERIVQVCVKEVMAILARKNRR